MFKNSTLVVPRVVHNAFEQAQVWRMGDQTNWRRVCVLEQRSDLEGAVAELKHVTKLDSGNPKAFYALGRVYRRLGQKEESLKALATCGKLKEEERRFPAETS